MVLVNPNNQNVSIRTSDCRRCNFRVGPHCTPVIIGCLIEGLVLDIIRKWCSRSTHIHNIASPLTQTVWCGVFGCDSAASWTGGGTGGHESCESFICRLGFDSPHLKSFNDVRCRRRICQYTNLMGWPVRIIVWIQNSIDYHMSNSVREHLNSRCETWIVEVISSTHC